MKQLTEETIHRCSYKYADEEERAKHIKHMTSQGWKVEEYFLQYGEHEEIFPHATFEQEFSIHL